ncbi:hypothetical protein TNCV_650191 [Trichonephila clavipes]|nr:hypothetical protein TNCV_650191 [Trichonephila clavipes]
MAFLVYVNSVIKFCRRLGKTPMETLEILIKVYGEFTIERSKVYDWNRRFKEGRESIEHNECVRQPSSRKTLRWCLNVFRNIVAKHLNKSLRLYTSRRRRLRESIHRSFAKREKGGNRLVSGPKFMVDALKLPNQAPRGSGESLQKSVAWRCPDGTQHLFC